MANTYFDFKSFRIEQEDCANKVSTDACVFGAWLNEFLPNKSIVLDVGSGSGLLSLILAQGSQRALTGIEIESACVAQAKLNVLNSPFSNIEVIHADMRDWKSDQVFDFIVSNPPFFNNSSKNPESVKNLARQTESLGPKDWSFLLNSSARKETTVALLLSNNDVLLAYQEELNGMGFNAQKIVRLLDTEQAPCKRVILLACQTPFKQDFEGSFYYKETDGNYSKRFKNLLKDYYLYL